MLTTFPYLLNFQIVAPFLLRVALAVVLLGYCYKTFKKNKLSILHVWKLTPNNWLRGVVISQTILAIMFLLGIFTQVVAILAIVSIIAKEIVLKKHGEQCAENSFLILFVAVCLSLIVLGPGIFSLDLPL